MEPIRHFLLCSKCRYDIIKRAATLRGMKLNSIPIRLPDIGRLHQVPSPISCEKLGVQRD